MRTVSFTLQKNIRKEIQNMNLKNKLKKAGAAITSGMVLSLVSAGNVFAAKKADVSEVTSGVDIIKQIALAIAGGIGGIFFIMGVMDFAAGWSATDSTQQLAGIKKIVAGVLMMAVSAIVALFE